MYCYTFYPILATDVAGVVQEVGPGVKNFKPGDEVVAVFNQLTGGGLAEYAVAKESLTVPRPPEVSAAEGAGLPIASLTAHLALSQSAGIKLDGSGPRKNVLITAASGADEVIDYKTPEGAALKSPSGQKYDVVIHCTTCIPWSVFEPNLTETGKVIDLTPGPSAMWTFAVKKLTLSKKQLVPLLLIPKKEGLDAVVKLAKEGKLKTVIDSKHPLSRADEAWAKGIDGHATGADEVIDYKTPEGAALKSPSGQKYDVVIHCTTGIPWSVFEPNLTETGKVIDLTPGPSAMWTFAVKKLTFSKKQLVPLLLIPKKEGLDAVVKLVKEGKLKTVIDSKHPLSRADEAWAKGIDGHATGKVIVEP
ncbi:unnamed protein product [Fraxinus pennsylvanica]|uniref:Enoyl reductase (ER) domain-containing protein n=1 Tax=Fraxinus pennsylvanica TaxID=56036 RepID=A0AAD1ZKH3_9LAMI|nr:unnamed protein product [Fraxinus pennsylvanica]